MLKCHTWQTPPIRHFTQHHTYLGTDAIAARDLGLAANQQVMPCSQQQHQLLRNAPSPWNLWHTYPKASPARDIHLQTSVWERPRLIWWPAALKTLCWLKGMFSPPSTFRKPLMSPFSTVQIMAHPCRHFSRCPKSLQSIMHVSQSQPSKRLPSPDLKQREVSGGLHPSTREHQHLCMRD